MRTIIDKRWKKHLKERDDDGFSICPIKQQKETRVASKKEWTGTNESRNKALKDQQFMDKHICCDFCSLCSELIRVLKSNAYRNRIIKPNNKVYK